MFFKILINLNFRKRVIDIGKRVSSFINFLYANALVPNLYTTNLIGHGLGAHIGTPTHSLF
jgi:hypothetical protein